MWSLGCVLYEMCRFRHAFESQSLLGLVYCIVSEHYEAIPEMYSEELAKLVAMLLAKSADERPSAREALALPVLQPYNSDPAPRPFASTAPAGQPRKRGHSKQLVPFEKCFAHLFWKMDIDLLNPDPREEKCKHKLKRMIQSPNSFLAFLRCPGCLQITTVFSHAQTVFNRFTFEALKLSEAPPPPPEAVRRPPLEDPSGAARADLPELGTKPLPPKRGMPRPPPPVGGLSASNWRSNKIVETEQAGPMSSSRARTAVEMNEDVQVVLARARGALLRRPRAKGNWVQAFARHDTTGLGELSVEQFAFFLQSLSVGLSLHEARSAY
eukprot:g11997.t1